MIQGVSSGAALAALGLAVKPNVKAVPAKTPAPVSYVDNIKKSGNINIDALLAGGNHWWHTAGGDGSNPSASAHHTVTFSFMSSAASPSEAGGFAALTGAQQDDVRSALAYISSTINVTFQEVGSGGDIQYGSNSQANSAGYAYYPGDSNGGNVLLANNQSTFQGSWTPGTYEYETLIHETAHALGLKHPGNYNAGGGGTAGPYLPGASDNRDNTVMSYHDGKDMRRVSYSNGMFSTSTINPSSYQQDDLLALQYLYGQPATPSQGTTYSWAADAAFTQTIYNSNASSTIDLSDQTKSNVIDLRAGNKSSIAVRDAYSDMPYSAKDYAKLMTTVNGKHVTIASIMGTPTYTGKNNLTIAAGSHIDNVIGGSGADTVITNGEDDTVSAGDGNDQVFVSGTAAGMDGTTIDGGNGTDTVYLQKKTGYTWSISQDGTTLTLTQNATKTSGASQVAQLALSNVETVKYWNGKTATKDAALYNAALAAPVAAKYAAPASTGTQVAVSA